MKFRRPSWPPVKPASNQLFQIAAQCRTAELAVNFKHAVFLVASKCSEYRARLQHVIGVCVELKYQDRQCSLFWTNNLFYRGSVWDT